MSKRFSVVTKRGRPSGTAAKPRRSREAMPAARSDSSLETDRQAQGELKELERHADNLLNGFEVMWRQNMLCDVTLVASRTCFRAHKGVLASCCDYFHTVFTGNPGDEVPDEVILDGVDPNSMAVLLECMYTGKVEINEANVRELLSASAQLQFYAIEEACGAFLRQRLTTGNCLRMLSLSSTYNLSSLADVALSVAAQNFLDVSEGFDYQQLDVDQLISLVSRDDVQAGGELNVFRRVLSWIEFDRDSRIVHAAELLQNVRLPLLSPSAIVDHVEAVDYLMDIVDCEKLVKEALRYHCLPARQSILQTSRTCPRTLYKKEVVMACGGAPRLKNDPVRDHVCIYDPQSNTWANLTKMKEPRHHHAAAVLGGFMYIAGGEQTNDQRSPLNSAWRYDPRNNTWLQIASMNHCRESFQLGVLDGALYAVGGRVDEDISLAEVERYSPAVDEWEVLASISGPRRSVAVAGHNGRLYAVGGSGHKRISGRVERYNPLTNQWENRRSLSIPRFFAMLQPVGNRLILFGGATLGPSGNVVCVRKVECYYPSTDTWSNISMMNEPRAEAGCATLGNRIYVTGGYSWDKELRLESSECYDTDKNTWTEVARIPVPLTGIACCSITVYDLPNQSAGGKASQALNAADQGGSYEDSGGEDAVDGDERVLAAFQHPAECLPRQVQSIM